MYYLLLVNGVPGCITYYLVSNVYCIWIDALGVGKGAYGVEHVGEIGMKSLVVDYFAIDNDFDGALGVNQVVVEEEGEPATMAGGVGAR